MSLRDFATHRTRQLSGTKSPLGHCQVISPTPTPYQDSSIPGALLPRSFCRMFPLLGPGPQQLLLQVALLHGPPLPCFGHQAWIFLFPLSQLQHQCNNDSRDVVRHCTPFEACFCRTIVKNESQLKSEENYSMLFCKQKFC